MVVAVNNAENDIDKTTNSILIKKPSFLWQIEYLFYLFTHTYKLMVDM